MTTPAGSPSLDRHVPRTEDRARIEAALKYAKSEVEWVDDVARPHLEKIIAILGDEGRQK